MDKSNIFLIILTIISVVALIISIVCISFIPPMIRGFSIGIANNRGLIEQLYADRDKHHQKPGQK